MRHAFALILLILAAAPAMADDPLAPYLWEARPVIVFADSPKDPRFRRQMDELSGHVADLEERDVVVLTDADPAAKGPLRKRLRPRGFQLVLVGKDGQVKLRTPHPMDIEALLNYIDRMPLRRREINGGQD